VFLIYPFAELKKKYYTMAGTNPNIGKLLVE